MADGTESGSTRTMVPYMGQVSPGFVQLLRKYGASPGLIRRMDALVDEQSPPIQSETEVLARTIREDRPAQDFFARPARSSDSIVSARDLKVRIKFFCGILGSMAVDIAYFAILLLILGGVHLFFNYMKTWFPEQVFFVKTLEKVALAGVSICCLYFIFLDVRNTLIRTREVMAKVDEG
jgi:hypothetical protein